MTNSKVIFETGATTHAVNHLILFTDNTRSLAEMRDNIYKRNLNFARKNYTVRVDWNVGVNCWFDNGGHYGWHLKIEIPWDRLRYDFIELLKLAILTYTKETEPDSNQHIQLKNLTAGQRNEFIELYANDFKNWKQDHGYK